MEEAIKNNYVQIPKFRLQKLSKSEFRITVRNKCMKKKNKTATLKI